MHCRDGVPRLLGVAAYQRVASDVRVVHEFLVHWNLDEREAAIVADTLVSAVEAMALGDSIHCLMFMLWPDVRRIAQIISSIALVNKGTRY